MIFQIKDSILPTISLDEVQIINIVNTSSLLIFRFSYQLFVKVLPLLSRKHKVVVIFIY